MKWSFSIDYLILVIFSWFQTLPCLSSLLFIFVHPYSPCEFCTLSKTPEHAWASFNLVHCIFEINFENS